MQGPQGAAEGSRRHGEAVLARLRERPGGEQLLALAGAREDVELVGGAARDLLLGGRPRELDVVVAADAPAFAAELARLLELPAQGEAQGDWGIAVHERFGTALLWWAQGRVDVAARRSESYAQPGALPLVAAGTPEQDLQRRDFTVNAIAVALGGPGRGRLRTAACALEDLAAGRLRVLHDDSFGDDPTRLLRLGRYRARLGFEPEAHTAELAAAAVAGGALATVSGARLGAELRLALAEPDPVAALAALAQLGVLGALEGRLGLEEALARAALADLPEDGRPDLLLLACLLLAMTGNPREDSAPAMFSLLDRLEFPAGDRDRALAAALGAPALVEQLADADTPSQLGAAARGAPAEALALACALAQRGGRPAAADAARRWLAELRHVRLRIGGEDLLAAGVPAGPEIGRRLAAALDMRLDGRLEDVREQQLRAALEAEL